MPFDSSSARSAQLSFGLSEVFVSEDEARRLGYGTTLAEGADAVSVWEQALTAAERDRYFRALSGPEGAKRAQITLADGTEMSSPTEGCISEARADLYGSVEQSLGFDGLVNEYLAAAAGAGNDRDARLAPLVPTFEKCMAERSYSVNGLGVGVLAEQLFGKYRSRADPPGGAEQRLAVSDYECQQEIDLRGELAASFAQGAAEWLRANEGKLLAMQEELKLVKDRAIAVINE